MFTLWYSILSYKEYSDVIWEKLSQKPPPFSASQPENACRLAPKREPPPKPVEPPKPQPPKSPEPPRSQIPKPQPPKPASPAPPPKLEPPAKPPRSPSPHPLRAEAFETIEYEEDEDDEDSEDSIDSLPLKKPGKFVNDFINVEISNSQAQQRWFRTRSREIWDI